MHFERSTIPWPQILKEKNGHLGHKKSFSEAKVLILALKDGLMGRQKFQTRLKYM